MTQKILKYLYIVMTITGVFRLFYHMNRHKKLVLTYHNIIPDDLFDHSVHLGVSHSVSVFESQLHLINKRFQNTDIQEKILITFDDGYSNQFEIASQILKKHGLYGVFFISFQLIENKKPLTIDLVLQWISYVPVGRYQLLNDIYDISIDNRHKIGFMIYRKLLKNYLLWDVIENALNDAYPFDELKINPDMKRLRFTPGASEDLNVLISAGHRVAAHSWNHRPLSTLPIEQQRKDFSLSKKYADKYCNSSWYSYPYGGIEEVSAETAKLCAEYGFTRGFMNIPCFPNLKNTEKNYQCTRICLPNSSDIYSLDAKLSGFEFFCKNTIKLITTLFFRTSQNPSGF